MALTTTDYDVHAFPLHQTAADKPLPPPPAVAITPCDPWPRPYYLENGLRRVAPYHYTYNTFCKQRWRGRGLLDIFATEFRDRTRDYYQQAIEEGRIVVNGKPCDDVNMKIQNGDVVSHTLHRHEPPVTAQPIKVIAETNEMIVIDKPAGVPVHPAGRYNYNSIVEIMRAERHYSFDPLPCNRLDRLTSGVMFIAKLKGEAENLARSLRQRTVRKEYVARVKGRFPDGEDWDGDPMRGGVIKCDEPILQISPVLGLNRARASGKSAKTLFRRIAYYPGNLDRQRATTTTEAAVSTPGIAIDAATTQPVAKPALQVEGMEDEGYSIVHCLPLTGRTHQIRVHLQFLGHPISNDPIYSNARVFGPNLGKDNASGDDDKEVMERLSRMGKTETPETAESWSQRQHHHHGSRPIVVDQTQQMTVRDAEQMLRREQDGLKHTVEAPLYHLPAGFKPLHSGTLHAGSLGPPHTDSGADADADAVASSAKHPTTTPKAHDGDGDDHDSLEKKQKQKQMNDEASDPTYQAFIRAHDAMVADYNKRKGEKLTGQVCAVCDTPLYSDPGPHELGIYLHALAYADLNGKWKYRSPMPEWGKPPPSPTLGFEHSVTTDTTDTTTTTATATSTAATSIAAPEVVYIDEWVYEGAGAEGLDIGDEQEQEKALNMKGMKKNKGQVDL